MLLIRYRLLVIIVLSALALSGCSQTEMQPLRLGTNVWPGYEPLYLARDIGEMPNNIKLIEYPSASEVIRAFRNHAIEAACLTLDEVLMLVHDDIPVKVVLVHDVSDGADTILARPDINSMAEIIGKRVAVESSALGAFMISRALELYGLSVEDIEVIHLDVNAHEEAYLSGDVDVVVNFEPVRTRLLNSGAREIFTSKEIPGEIVDVLVIHEEVFSNRRSDVQSIVNGWFKALSYYQSEGNKAAEIMAKRLNISPDEVIASFDGLELPSRQRNIVMLGGEQPLLESTSRRLEEVLKEKKLISSDMRTPSIFSAEFISN